MKKLLLILLCLPMIGFGQKTYIPCDAFEAELISLGYDTILDDSVYTNSINSIVSLQLGQPNYFFTTFNSCDNLTGIEDFDSLINLSVFGDVKNIDLSNNYSLEAFSTYNDSLLFLDLNNLSNLTYLTLRSTSLNNGMPITYLDLSSNISLENLDIGCNPITFSNCSPTTLLGGAPQLSQIDLTNNLNLKEINISHTGITSITVSNLFTLQEVNIGYNFQLTSLNLSNNPNLYSINCSGNLIDQIDISNNPMLSYINCSYNNIPCLDFSSLNSLQYFDCKDNLLEKLVLKSPNWMNMYGDASVNLLTCIEVDNVLYANTHFTIDSFASFSTNCNYTNPCNSVSSIQEQTTNKELLKVTDLLGRETKQTNQPLFYIYDDGTVEKRIMIKQ